MKIAKSIKIEDINYIPVKSCCYIRYEHRCFAEFAKEAMMKQSLVGEEIISVKWAFDDNNPMTQKVNEKEEDNLFETEVINKFNQEQKRMSQFGQYQNYSNPIVNNSEQMVQNCTQLNEFLNEIEQNKEGTDEEDNNSENEDNSN